MSQENSTQRADHRHYQPCPMPSKNITNLNATKANFNWINIINPQKEEIDYLRNKFKFNELDLKDAYAKNESQRPKFYVRNDYSFLILQFPVYNEKTGTVDAEEVNFFIGPTFVITCHRNKLPPIKEFLDACLKDKFYMAQYLVGDEKMMLLYEIIVRLQEYCYPIMDHMSLDIKKIESNIFSGREREMVHQILLIKRNILHVRKIMEAHKDVIQKLSKSKAGYLNSFKMGVYYSDLIDHTKNIWDILSGQKELIEALEHTNSSLISFKLNDIMRILTIISVFIFPLSLIAGIFSMRTEGSMPFMDNPHSFWMVIGIMSVIWLVMFLYFRKKRWL